MRLLVVAATLLVAAAPASASLIHDLLAPVNDIVEPNTGLTVGYQEDAQAHGDAPATCELATAEFSVHLDQAATAGMLVEVDDESDAYFFELGDGAVGERVGLDLLAGAAVARHDIAFDVLAPGCGSSVLDPESPYYETEPVVPYEPAEGQAMFEGDVVDYDCNETEWKFHANKVGRGSAPETIYVEWTDGSAEYLSLSKASSGTVAMYVTSSHLEYTVARAVILLASDYDGDFKIAHGPCDAIEGNSGPQPPTHSATRAEFTVQEAGPHVVVVYIGRGTVDKTVDTLEDLVANPPTSMNRNCHKDICTAALQFTNYDVGASQM